MEGDLPVIVAAGVELVGVGPAVVLDLRLGSIVLEGDDDGLGVFDTLAGDASGEVDFVRVLARGLLECVFGLFLLGDGIQPNKYLEDASVLDVMPTLLYAAGCPIGRDLDGRVLIAAFQNSFLAQTPLTFVPSYETLTRELAAAP